ncbi:MAG: transposase [Opitutales bacterium]
MIRILRENEGLKVEAACRQHNISPATCHRWKGKYGQMDEEEAQRLCDLKKENTAQRRFFRRLGRNYQKPASAALPLRRSANPAENS